MFFPFDLFVLAWVSILTPQSKPSLGRNSPVAGVAAAHDTAKGCHCREQRQMKFEKEPLPHEGKRFFELVETYTHHSPQVLGLAVILIKVVPISVVLILSISRANVAHGKNRHHKNTIILIVKHLCRGGKGCRRIGLLSDQRPPATARCTGAGGRYRRCRSTRRRRQARSFELIRSCAGRRRCRCRHQCCFSSRRLRRRRPWGQC